MGGDRDLECPLGGDPPDRNLRSGRRYDSLFVHWDERASVRRRPQRHFEGFEATQPLFPPELHPIVLHPLVEQPGMQEALLGWRLYDYVDFTAELESEIVIPVAMSLARGRSGLMLPAGMAADAWKIVTDEAWHAQFSHDFLDQLRRDAIVPSLPGAPRHAFGERLDVIRAHFPDELLGLTPLLFAIVSETLISGILSEIPRDDRLPQSVRALVADHAADEGRHHAYFRAILRRLWPTLSGSERRAVGCCLPQVVRAFLEPDYGRTRLRLLSAGLDDEQSRQVVAETWTEEVVAAQVRSSAHQTLGYFATVGAFEDPAAEDALAASGLVAE